MRALRVIVEDERQCYAALGVIHGRWPALPEEFDDYNRPPQVQRLCIAAHGVFATLPAGHLKFRSEPVPCIGLPEFGVAAHWRYKELAVPATALAIATTKRSPGCGSC